MEKQSILEQILGYIMSFGHWVVETFHHFMYWAFPNYMRFHESAIAAQKAHDPYYYLSLKWLFVFLGFIGTKIGHGLEWLFVGKTFYIWHRIEHTFSHYGLLGKLILIVLGLVFLLYTYVVIRFIFKIQRHIYRGIVNNFRFAKLRYGTYWAITKPKRYVNERAPDEFRHRVIEKNPSLGTKDRIIQFMFENPFSLVVFAPLIALAVILGAYAIHYVGYIPFAFYVFAWMTIRYFIRVYQCNEEAMTFEYSVGVMIAFYYLLFTNFDLGFHGYIIDAISYISGLKQPLDFDPMIYTFFFYLGFFYLVRYLIYHFYGEPMKVKAYKARGIDLCAIYDANEAKFAQEKIDRKARKKRFKQR